MKDAFRVAVADEIVAGRNDSRDQIGDCGGHLFAHLDFLAGVPHCEATGRAAATASTASSTVVS